MLACVCSWLVGWWVGACFIVSLCVFVCLFVWLVVCSAVRSFVCVAWFGLFWIGLVYVGFGVGWFVWFVRVFVCLLVSFCFEWCVCLCVQCLFVRVALPPVPSALHSFDDAVGYQLMLCISCGSLDVSSSFYILMICIFCCCVVSTLASNFLLVTSR